MTRGIHMGARMRAHTDAADFESVLVVGTDPLDSDRRIPGKHRHSRDQRTSKIDDFHRQVKLTVREDV